MSQRSRGWPGVIVAVGIIVACGSEPPTEPESDPLVYQVGGFRIEDATREAPPTLIDSIATALGDAVTGVTAFLPEFVLPDDTLTFRLVAGQGFPYATPTQLLVVQFADDLSLEYLPHQVTHVLTGYTRRPFIEEGVAVYVTEALDPAGTIAHPHRGQPLHAWVSLFEQHGSTIPLTVVFGAGNLGYDYYGSTADASAWQLYLEAGSFTRWVFATYGREAWIRMYDLDNLTAGLNADPTDLERDWLAATRDAHRNPLPCEEALATRGPLGTREQFWCARARGE